MSAKSTCCRTRARAAANLSDGKFGVGIQASTIYVAVEMSGASWVVGINSPSCPEKTSKFTFKARDTDSLAARVEEKRALFERDHGVLPRALLTYEAGFEGFWPARVFHGRHGYEIVICDPASLEVSRRKKQVKTDRIDADRMIRALKLWDDGDMDALSHVRVPTLEQEDNRQLLRERERLVGMRVGLSNSILSQV